MTARETATGIDLASRKSWTNRFRTTDVDKLCAYAAQDVLDGFLKDISTLAIGVSIFNFIYWNCSFVRMGTSGLTAQAFGAGNFRECTNMLVRAMVVAAGMGLLMLALQYPLGEQALWGLNGNEMTRE